MPTITVSRVLDLLVTNADGYESRLSLKESEAIELIKSLNEALGQPKSVMDNPKLPQLKVVFDRLFTRANDNNILGFIDNLRDIRQLTGTGLKEAKDFQEYCIWRFRDNYSDDSRFYPVAKTMDPHSFPGKLLDLYYALVCLNDLKVDELTMMEHLNKL
jgi:hypothetical protein